MLSSTEVLPTRTGRDSDAQLNIQQAYDKLVASWGQRLHQPPESLDAPANASGLPSDKQHLHSACMSLFDSCLEQQWKDSQDMLQCAQAWSTRQNLDKVEAVRTLNVLSLRTMQRSLDARRDLLGLLENSSCLPLLSPHNNDHTEPSITSQSKTTDPYTPLDRDVPAACRRSDDEHCMFTMSSGDEEEEMHAPLLRRHPNESKLLRLANESMAAKVLAPDTDPTPSDPQPRRLPVSPSAPAFSMHEEGGGIHKNHCKELSAWKKKLMEDSSSEENYSEEGTWRSWFAPTPSTHTPLSDGQGSANFCEPLFDPIVPRSESSISAFRPISKNLAPRCAPISRSCAESSCSSTSSGSKKIPKWGRKTMTKSRSFPTKMKAKDDSPPLPAPKVNSVMRSIISKKASLTRLFANKKAIQVDILEE